MARPAGVPEPVERFYWRVYGDQVPVYHSAVYSGRGTVRFMGITLPARLRFTHDTGNGYRHYIEATFFGIPVMNVNERYLGGKTRLELPFGVVENDPGIDSAANQGLWAEMSVYPAAFVSDTRARWEGVDATAAKLYVPWGEDEQVFTVEFDPETGMISRMETLRYRDEKVGTLRWWGELEYNLAENEEPKLDRLEVTWEDEGTPWLVFNLEEIVFNSDVSEYIKQRGP